MFRDFWWHGIQENSDKRPLYLKAWVDICKPKHEDEGGLGIRDFQAVNEALLTTAAWRLVNEPQTVAAQVLKSEIFS